MLDKKQAGQYLPSTQTYGRLRQRLVISLSPELEELQRKTED